MWKVQYLLLLELVEDQAAVWAKLFCALAVRVIVVVGRDFLKVSLLRFRLLRAELG